MQFNLQILEVVPDHPCPTVRLTLGCINAAQHELVLWRDETIELIKMLAIGARQTGNTVVIGGQALDDLRLETEAGWVKGDGDFITSMSIPFYLTGSIRQTDNCRGGQTAATARPADNPCED